MPRVIFRNKNHLGAQLETKKVKSTIASSSPGAPSIHPSLVRTRSEKNILPRSGSRNHPSNQHVCKGNRLPAGRVRSGAPIPTRSQPGGEAWHDTCGVATRTWPPLCMASWLIGSPETNCWLRGDGTWLLSGSTREVVNRKRGGSRHSWPLFFPAHRALAAHPGQRLVKSHRAHGRQPTNQAQG